MTPRKWRRWTARDDEQLRTQWGEGSLRSLAAAIGRTELTTYWRARKLGLPRGCPQGLEYLTHAATRVGFATSQLRVILRAAGVRLQRSMSRPTGAKRSFHVVDPVDVDDAVATWLATEVLEAAAGARGLDGGTLLRALTKAGVEPLKTSRGQRTAKAVRRYATADIERVVAERNRLLSVSAHARRLGVYRVKLAKQLRAVGVLGPKCPGNGGKTLLPVDVVDAARRAA